MKWLAASLLILSLSSCALFGGAERSPPQTVQAETIEKVEQESTVNNTNIPMEYMLLLCLMAGWAIPSPQAMFGGVASFILKLMGRG